MNERIQADLDDEARRRIRVVQDPITMLQAVAARAPRRDAIVHLRDWRDLSPVVYRYRDAADIAARFAAALTASGVAADDVVAIIAPPIPEMLLALAGAAGVAIAFPINPSLSAESMASQLALANVRAVVAFGQHPAMPLHRVVAQAVRLAGVGLVIEIETEHGPSDVLLDCAPRRVSWSDFLARSNPQDARPVRGDRAAFLFHTGGTSGAPKLAELGLRAAMSALHASAVGFGWLERDRVLQLLPFFHVGGAFTVGMGLFSSGTTLMNCGLAGARDPETVASLWSIAARQQATVIVLVPATWSLVAAQAAPPRRWPQLRAIVTGATSMAPELAERLERIVGLPISQALGMTELSGAGASQPLDGIVRPPAVGYPAPLVETKLVPLFQSGQTELHVRGPMLFRGYRTLDGLIGSPGEGWYASGDLGEILSDGQLRLVGRAKDVIIRSGHNIDPLAIEDVICRHPAIVMAAAVGMPDAFAGELPIVYAVRKANPAVDEEAIADFVAQHIDEPTARPKRIIFLEALPLTQVGKVARYRLRQAAVTLRVSEILSGISGITEIRCDDVAARRVTIEWTVDPSDEVRAAVDTAVSPLGIALLHCAKNASTRN